MMHTLLAVCLWALIAPFIACSALVTLFFLVALGVALWAILSSIRMRRRLPKPAVVINIKRDRAGR